MSKQEWINNMVIDAMNTLNVQEKLTHYEQLRLNVVRPITRATLYVCYGIIPLVGANYFTQPSEDNYSLLEQANTIESLIVDESTKQNQSTKNIFYEQALQQKLDDLQQCETYQKQLSVYENKKNQHDKRKVILGWIFLSSWLANTVLDGVQDYLKEKIAKEKEKITG